MYNEIKQIDKIEVVNGNIIQVREVTIITKENVEIARTYHRWSFTNLEDMKGMPKEVNDIAKVVFTEEVKRAYQELLKENT